ncbi:MAG: SlyX family protein [Gammaproteobacteria bacterium]|nr:SlyX family protein [Gammaproteobacteria bacterium]MCK5091997.1 SlyX family protein [Gammaproteobacteria bacterium]
MESRIIDLETRYAHQEASIDELTQTVLRQQTRIEQMTNELEQVKSMLQDLATPNIASPHEETPPPHY